jgi:hypothetical protein
MSGARGGACVPDRLGSEPAGCALERTVTYAYYAETRLGDTCPRQSEFVHKRRRSAQRRGFVAVRGWGNITTLPRIRSATVIGRTGA